MPNRMNTMVGSWRTCWKHGWIDREDMRRQLELQAEQAADVNMATLSRPLDLQAEPKVVELAVLDDREWTSKRVFPEVSGLG